MSIPVSAMHDDIRDGYLSKAEIQIESDPAWTHAVAGRDAVRLAYILWVEAGNADLWEEARTNYRSQLLFF